ncbi:MAG TPA: carboxypeptidase-like regulatory domain-containing protein [Bryobacteraceae bacterium]|nr:carboxypeptidase-like regulatory domain-containing protein [Bryobacteraceae bacterium]
MKKWGTILLACCAPAFAAVSGTVIDRTTGKPVAGVSVELMKFGQGGMTPAASAKTDAKGSFAIDADVQGPQMVRTTIDGVAYNKMVPPGTPSTGIVLDVYQVSKRPGPAKVTKHMILFQPNGSGQMVINETYIYENTGKTTWNDPDGGTLHYFMPTNATGQADVSATSAGSVAVPEFGEKTSRPDIFKVDFPVKPGETRFDLNYTVPYTMGQEYAGKIATKDEMTYLIVPNGVTIQGANLKDLGQEPRTQAHIYGLNTETYNVTLGGAEVAAAAPAAGTDNSDAGPQIEQIMPRLYGKAELILLLVLGILALGFALLYRAHPAQNTAKETNERGRR